MRTPNKIKSYYKLEEDDIFFKMESFGKDDVTVTEISDAGIIIYDTRISRNVVREKFDDLELLDSTKEEFYKRYQEIKDKDLK